jgi:hypothetical protein
MDVKRDSEQMFGNPVEIPGMLKAEREALGVEAEQPRYESPLLALMEGRRSSEPTPIEIPPPSPENEARIRQMGERLGREVEKARERAYGEGTPVVSEGAKRFMAVGRPIADAELSPGDLARLNGLRAEWKAWHEDPANADWRPEGGDLVVG